jgi:eukaryotic-like serine/threonine-protein kinase
VIGHGGMGDVWRGRDLRLNRDVAVKMMRDPDPDPKALRRFQREAAVAASLQHPAITAVFDSGQHHGRLFIVTELLHGMDLRELLADSEGTLPVSQAVDFGMQVADALAVMHAKGVMHRDLKPGNVIVLADDCLKVCDFGLAKDVNAQTEVTESGDFFGTVRYMAPEQFEGKGGASSDLYALGCIMYEMVTGRPPFPGPTRWAYFTQHLSEVPAAPRDLNPAVPAALSDLVMSLLAKVPGDRPADATVVLDTLGQVRDGLPGGSARGRGPAPQSPPRPRYGRGVPAMTALCTLLAAGGLAFALQAGGGSSGPERNPTEAGGAAAHVAAVRPAESPPPAPSPSAFAVSHGRPVALSNPPALDSDGNQDAIGAVAFNASGSVLATGNIDGSIDLRNAATLTVTRSLTGIEGVDYPVNCEAFTPGGTLVVGGDQAAYIVRTDSGGFTEVLGTLDHSVTSCALSPSGTTLAFEEDDLPQASVYIDDLGSGTVTWLPLSPAELGDGLAYSPNGDDLAIGCANGSVAIWNLKSQKLAGSVSIPGIQLVESVAYSPDGKFLAVSDYDNGRVYIVNIASGAVVHSLTDPGNLPVDSLAISPSGTTLATVDSGAHAYAWDIASWHL